MVKVTWIRNYIIAVACDMMMSLISCPFLLTVLSLLLSCWKAGCDRWACLAAAALLCSLQTQKKWFTLLTFYPNPSEGQPPAHSDRCHGDGPGAGSADSRRDLLVPSANCWVPGVLRGGPLQPDQLQPGGPGGEEHPGIWHGAERAGRVAGSQPYRYQTRPPTQTVPRRGWFRTDVVAFMFFVVSFETPKSILEGAVQSAADWF